VCVENALENSVVQWENNLCVSFPIAEWSTLNFVLRLLTLKS
jgi:hypothetical protein